MGVVLCLSRYLCEVHARDVDETILTTIPRNHLLFFAVSTWATGYFASSGKQSRRLIFRRRAASGATAATEAEHGGRDGSTVATHGAPGTANENRLRSAPSSPRHKAVLCPTSKDQSKPGMYIQYPRRCGNTIKPHVHAYPVRFEHPFVPTPPPPPVLVETAELRWLPCHISTAFLMFPTFFPNRTERRSNGDNLGVSLGESSQPHTSYAPIIFPENVRMSQKKQVTSNA